MGIVKGIAVALRRSLVTACDNGKVYHRDHANDLAQRYTLKKTVSHNWQTVVFHEDPIIRGIPLVSRDGDSDALSPFLVFAGGKRFFIRRERFDPNGRGRGFLCRFC
jgi:hypothetical protein